MLVIAKGITSGVLGLVVVEINCFLPTFVNKSFVINPITLYGARVSLAYYWCFNQRQYYISDCGHPEKRMVPKHDELDGSKAPFDCI